MIIELSVAVLLLLVSAILLLKNFKVAVVVLMVLSVFLHKELFSLYRWDLLPVRLFMLALCATSGIWLVASFFKEKKLFVRKLTAGIKDPFTITLILLWVVRAASIIFSKNLPASFFLLAFFTTIVVLGVVLYNRFKESPDEIIKYIKIYGLVVLGACLFAFFQFFVYLSTGKVIGALWNVPGHLPRVGSLFWDVNHFGGLIAGLLPVLAIFTLTSKSLRQKIGYTLLCIPLTAVLVMTNSRTSWISAVVALLTFVIILAFRKLKLKGIAIVFSILVLVSIPLLIEYSNKASPFRAKIKQYFHYRIDSFDSHLLLLRGTIAVFGNYPILGGGYGSFFEQFQKTKVAAEFYGRDPAALSVRVPAHTIWGEALAETGAVGFSVLLLFLLCGLLPLIYIALTYGVSEKYLTASAMFSALVGWLAAGVFYSYNSEFFWLIFFFYFIWGVGTLGKENLEKVYKWVLHSQKLPVAVLLGISIFLLFINLGKNHLLPWDEAIYAQIAKNMVVKNEYINLYWQDDDIWYEKPPFGMWAMALSFKLIGFSDFAVRLPSAIFGLFTVITVYLFGKRLANKTVGFLSAFVLLTTFNYLYYARASMLDVTATFFITFALYNYWLFKSNDSRKNLIFSGISIGLAIMTKGVIGFVPFAVIGLYELYLFISRQQGLSKKLIKNYLMLFLVSAAIFLPWHLEMYRRFGNAFISNYIGYHVLDRAASAIEDKGRPFLWYVTVMKVSMRIWFIALIPAILLALVKVIKRDNKFVFLLIWALFIFVLFSSSVSKLKWYIIPIYPVTALMVGVFVEWVIDFMFKRLTFIKPVMFKGLMLYAVVMVGLTYLYANRVLVYESDLTGAQAILLQTKDEMFGTEHVILADRIDLPILLYYTKSPFEIVDFGPLRDKLGSGDNVNPLFYVTKESRFRKLKETYPGMEQISSNKEWVLGMYSTMYRYDSQKQRLVPLN
ncbi:MAG: Glycosyl transferase, family 39 [uncultured bacterium]|nr:MAG: Glycosyl transferase, family 39 [uncultured bacterium]